MANDSMVKSLAIIKLITIAILIINVCKCSSRDESFEFMSKGERDELKEEARDMFYHAYNAYMDNAYPADELMPLSCKGRYRGSEIDRGDIDSVLGNFSLTLVDTLDTLVVLGDLGEFESAVKLVVRDVSFETDVIVSLFETNIRMLGGLLSGHILSEYLQLRADIMPWYRGELLTLAKDLGYRFLPAFNTTTGIPYGRINLKYGMKVVPTEMCKETCTACAGSMILEMAALSRLTGETIFEEKAQKAMDALWKIRHRGTDLMGSVLNVHSGDWVRRDSGVGAGIDSYYEYCLKAYILLGDEKYLGRFNKHYQAIMKYVSQGPMLLDVHMHRPNTNSKNFMDALLAFWPGLQVLKGDIKPAVETHEMLYQVMQRHNFIPEAFTTDFQVHWGHHPLRPEFLESTYFLYRATSDHYYLGVGRKVLKSLQTYARVPCGYAAVSDVRTNKHDDTMDSFVLSETLKYLFLLFAEPNDLILDLDEFIFTTEGHLLPLTLGAMRMNASLEVDTDVVEVDELDRTCPNSLHLFPASVRQPLLNMIEDVCPRRSTRRRISASQFQSNSLEHLKLLSNMGIVILKMADGRMQLLHTFSNAKSMEDAQEGLMFMHDMMELNKKQSLETEKRRIAISFVTTHTGFVEEVTLIGGPAEFGLQLKGLFKVFGKSVIAEPMEACEELTNADKIKGNIAIVYRGNCMFVEKSRIIQKAGATAGIVLDTVIGTSIFTSPMFAMAGDGIDIDDIKIPMAFLFNIESKKLIQAMNVNPGAIFLTMGEHVNKEFSSDESEDHSSIFERLRTSVQQFLTRPATPTESNNISPESSIMLKNEIYLDFVIEIAYLRATIPRNEAHKTKKTRTSTFAVNLTTKLSSIPKPTLDSFYKNEKQDLTLFQQGWQAFKKVFITQIHMNTKIPPNQVININQIEALYDWLQKERNLSKIQPSSENLDTIELVSWFLNELSDTLPNYDSSESLSSILFTFQSFGHQFGVVKQSDKGSYTTEAIEIYQVYAILLETIQNALSNLQSQLQSEAKTIKQKKEMEDNFHNLQKFIEFNFDSLKNSNKRKSKINEREYEQDVNVNSYKENKFKVLTMTKNINDENNNNKNEGRNESKVVSEITEKNIKSNKMEYDNHENSIQNLLSRSSLDKDENEKKNKKKEETSRSNNENNIALFNEFGAEDNAEIDDYDDKKQIESKKKKNQLRNTIKDVKNENKQTDYGIQKDNLIIREFIENIAFGSNKNMNKNTERERNIKEILEIGHHKLDKNLKIRRKRKHVKEEL